MKKLTHDVSLTIDDRIFSGKDCIVKSLEIRQEAGVGLYPLGGVEIDIRPNPVEITIDLMCMSEDFIMEMFDEKAVKKIRRKSVDSCSIQELLFAVRAKLKEK